MTTPQAALLSQVTPPPVIEPDPLPPLHALTTRTERHLRRVQAVLGVGQQVDINTLAGELSLLQTMFAEFINLTYANHRYERILISDIEEDTDELADELAEVDGDAGGGIPPKLAQRIATLLGLLVNSLNASLAMANAEQRQQSQLVIAECEEVVRELGEYVDDEEDDDDEPAVAAPEA